MTGPPVSFSPLTMRVWPTRAHSLRISRTVTSFGDQRHTSIPPSKGAVHRRQPGPRRSRRERSPAQSATACSWLELQKRRLVSIRLLPPFGASWAGSSWLRRACVTQSGESFRGRSHERQISGPPLSRCRRRARRYGSAFQTSWIVEVLRSPSTVRPSKSAQQRDTRPSHKHGERQPRAGSTGS